MYIHDCMHCVLNVFLVKKSIKCFMLYICPKLLKLLVYVQQIRVVNWEMEKGQSVQKALPHPTTLIYWWGTQI